ncbi:MAG: hypothetical protein U0Y10_15085 [Spirosomataceae bacterium]
MKLLLFRFLFCPFIFILSLSISSAQTVDEIYERYLDAVGGHQKIDSIKTIKITGFTQNSVEQKNRLFKAYHQFPNLLKYELFNENNSFWTCFDGKNLWTYLPQKGVPVMSSSFGGEVDVDPMFNYFINYKSRNLQSVSVLKKTIDNKSYFEVHLKGNNRDYLFYLDEKSFELSLETVISPNSTRETTYSDYRKINGILMPFLIETKNQGSTFSTSRIIQVIEFNAVFDSSIFNCSNNK